MDHSFYMYRCLELARKGAASVAPNPMVGAVLVHQDRIIGEGWHELYGQAHAEVNCIESVREEDKKLISQSILYVSLEPCAHTGKTPPCADMILQYGIETVVIGCRDPFLQVNGKGMEKLRNAGVTVIPNVLHAECRAINKRFFTFHEQHRPYIVLKWAQTADQFIAGVNDERLLISNALTNRMVHQWRACEMGILIGTNTAMNDDPALTNRLWTGRSPIRLVIDRNRRLPVHLKIFNGEAQTIIFNTQKAGFENGVEYYRLHEQEPLLPQLLAATHQLGIQSIMVEGGARLLQSFIDAGYWDEARVITNTTSSIGNGLSAPVLTSHAAGGEQRLENDIITTWYKQTGNTF